MIVITCFTHTHSHTLTHTHKHTHSHSLDTAWCRTEEPLSLRISPTHSRWPPERSQLTRSLRRSLLSGTSRGLLSPQRETPNTQQRPTTQGKHTLTPCRTELGSTGPSGVPSFRGLLSTQMFHSGKKTMCLVCGGILYVYVDIRIYILPVDLEGFQCGFSHFTHPHRVYSHDPTSRNRNVAQGSRGKAPPVCCSQVCLSVRGM